MTLRQERREKSSFYDLRFELALYFYALHTLNIELAEMAVEDFPTVEGHERAVACLMETAGLPAVKMEYASAVVEHCRDHRPAVSDCGFCELFGE